MKVVIRELGVRFVNLKRRLRPKVKRRDVIVLGFFLLIFLIGYIFHFIHSIYKCMNYECIVIDAVDINCNNKTLFVDTTFKDSISPINIKVKNITIDVQIFNNKLLRLEGTEINFHKNEVLNIKHDFNIIINKNYKFKRLENIKELRTIKMRMNMKLTKNIFGFNVTMPFQYVYNHQIPKVGNSLLIFQKHTVSIKNRNIKTIFSFGMDYLNIKLDSFQFNCTMNGKEVATVIFKEYKHKRYLALTTFSKAHTGNIVDEVGELLSKKEVKLDFAGFIFNPNFDTSFGTIISKLISTNARVLQRGDGPLKMTDSVPALEFKIKNIIKTTVSGELSIHHSLIDNFVTSEYFLNRVSLPSLKFKVNATGTVNSKLASLTMKIRERENYLSLDFELAIIDISSFIRSLILQEDDNFLKISCVSENFIGEILEKVSFLWNYYNHFDFTYNDSFKNPAHTDKTINTGKVNLFGFDSKINADENGVDAACSLTLPKPVHPAMHIVTSWPESNIRLINEGINARITLKPGSLNLRFYDFKHISDAFRSNGEISFALKLRKAAGNISDCIRITNNAVILSLFLSLNYQIYQKDDKDCIKGEFKHTFEHMRILKKPTVSRILSHLKFQFDHLYSFSHFRVNLLSKPIKKTESNYRLVFNIAFPKIEMGVRNKDKVNEFASVTLWPSNLNVYYSDGFVHHLTLKSGEKEKSYVPFDIRIAWNEMSRDSIEFKNIGIVGRNFMSFLIATFISDIQVRMPGINEVQVYDKDIPNTLVFTDENLKISGKMNLFEDRMKGNIKINLPNSSFVMKTINNGFVSASWDEFKLFMVDDDDKTADIDVGGGKISIRLEEENKNYQEHGSFYLNYDFSTAFDYNTIKSVQVTQYERVRNIVFDKTIKKFINDILYNNKKEEKLDIIKNLVLIENDRKVMKDNGTVELESDMSIQFKDLELISKISSRIGWIISRLSLINYPRRAKFDFEITKDIVTSLIPGIKMSMKSNLITELQLDYGGQVEKTNDILIDSVTYISINKYNKPQESSGNNTNTFESKESSKDALSKYGKIAFYLLKHLSSTLKIEKGKMNDALLSFKLPLRLDLSKSKGTIQIYRNGVMIISIDLSLITQSNQTDTQLYISFHDTSFKFSGNVIIFYVDDKNVSIELFVIPLDIMPSFLNQIFGMITMNMSIVMVQKLLSIINIIKRIFSPPEIGTLKKTCVDAIDYVLDNFKQLGSYLHSRAGNMLGV